MSFFVCFYRKFEISIKTNFFGFVTFLIKFNYIETNYKCFFIKAKKNILYLIIACIKS